MQKLNHWAEEQPGFRRSNRRREQCRKIGDNGTLYKAGRPQINRWYDLWDDCYQLIYYSARHHFLDDLYNVTGLELTAQKTLGLVFRHTALFLRWPKENSCFKVLLALTKWKLFWRSAGAVGWGDQPQDGARKHGHRHGGGDRHHLWADP